MDKNTTAGCSPIQPPLIKRLEIRPSSSILTPKLCESPGSPGVKLWQSAFQKLRSRSTKLEPWKDFKLDAVVTKSAIRHRYSAIKKKWIKDDISIKLEDTAFDRGAMRECFRMKKMPDNGDWYQASNYVAKRYIANVNNSVYFDDVRLQMEAKLWCEAFNRQNPPKKVDVFQMAVIEIPPDSATSPQACSENKRRNSVTTLNAAVTDAKSESTFYHIERYMDGEYRKYNSNSGFVDTKLRNTPQAFSHFTFERSGHRLLVVDIQGVGDLYTDPQIHTADGLGYNDGNLGVRGMALFFHSHRCNPLCEYLGLSPFDLSAHEINSLPEVSQVVEDEVSVDQESDNEDCDVDNDDDDDNNDDNSEKSLSIRGGRHRFERANLFLQAHLQPRKRSLSFGMIPSSFTTSVSSSASSRQLIYGPTVVKDLEFLCTPRFRTHSGSVNSFSDVPFCRSSAASHSGFPPPKSQEGPSRLRQTSGDSGIFASCHPSHRLSSDDFPLPDRLLAFDRDDECHFPESGQSFNWPPDGACGDDELDAYLADLQSPSSPISIQNQLLKPPVTRLMRTVSESSDIDDFEPGRPLNNNLHQVMHETHKPSSAVHPSNLDQEIGQSILGQIHHELARLHEAGRFLKRPGGWSKTGLGGLNLSQDHDEESEDSGVEQIDWESVIFHEWNAAQLGCLEALIIMAHYYLGLPTQLLSECSIASREEDLCLGVDYLWRSSEGGDRRCMILLARYLDASVVFGDNGKQAIIDVSDPNALTTALNLRTTPKEDFLLLLSHKTSLPIPAAAAGHLGGGVWAEAVTWYKRAVENAGVSVAGSPPSPLDEGCDAEGRYDAAEDLSPVHRLLARMAEMYMVGGNGLTCDFSMAGDLFTQAAESAMQLSDGRLASKYFEIAEVAYGYLE